MRQISLLESERLDLEGAMAESLASLRRYGGQYDHWVMTFSGGKDSTTLVSLVLHFIESGQLAAPQRLTVLMSDTKQEFLPLLIGAQAFLRTVQSKGAQTQVVWPPLDQRLYVYMLGRGVPPANGDHFRWCTRILKADPMTKVVQTLDPQPLVLTGVRQGESAVRDQRIALSCSANGGECGQGWFQNMEGEATLAPLLQWRLCHIEDWLSLFAPDHGFDTRAVCQIYGLGEGEMVAQALNLRTGCAGCMLITKDRALARIIALPEWSYLAPLTRLQTIFAELRKPYNRLRKQNEVNKNGQYSARQGRLGPLTMAARAWGLAQVLAVQAQINDLGGDRPHISLIDPEEVDRIKELWRLNTWPEKWTGEEIRGDALVDKVTLVKGNQLARQKNLFLESG